MSWPRYVFVGGLHRSGTSLVARLIAAHPEVAAMTGTGVPEDEGVFLQGAIPHTARHGVPGRFAFDPAQHHTEDSPFNRLETLRRLERDWEPHFPPDRPWRLEKSPVNLLRTRLYQQFFPMAHFVLVVRHPYAVAQATGKWSDDGTLALVRHWAHAHELMLEDLRFLHAALVLRYEDLCDDPAATLWSVFRFLQLDPGLARPGPVREGNADYAGLTGLSLPDEAVRLGYRPSLFDRDLLSPALAVRHPLRAVREAVAEALAPPARRRA